MIVLDLKTKKAVDARMLPTAVLCLGNFDGVHRGHAALIRETIALADHLRADFPDIKAGAWCFALPPRRYLCGERSVQITSLREKADLMADMGLDCLYLGDFAALRQLSPEIFVRDVLKAQCHCVATVCGFNHRFGCGGMGHSSHLEAAFGERAKMISPVNDMGQGVVISSSRIRSLILCGQMEEAVQLLGHPFVLSAPVMHGKALGRTLGLPTVNQNFPAGHLIPARGIYATRIKIGERSYMGVTNVGCRPTVEQSDRVNCETHILDYNGTLYGEIVNTEFYVKLRDERKFSGLGELMEAIRADADVTRSYFAGEVCP